MYKSTDAGKTWKHIGLSDTSQIPRVRIHPQNPDLVYVAALGHVYGPNDERGIFRSKDGGRTWEKILFRDNKTGAIDLILDLTNPRIPYAALWEANRTPWSLTSGGPGSSKTESLFPKYFFICCIFPSLRFTFKRYPKTKDCSTELLYPTAHAEADFGTASPCLCFLDGYSL